MTDSTNPPAIPAPAIPEAEVIEPSTIKGYQWGDDGSFIGVYPFPNNQDKEEIHLPPRTTLIAPPTIIPAGYEAAFDVSTQKWVIRVENLSWFSMQTIGDPGV